VQSAFHQVSFVNSDVILKAELAKALAECERLREENARLRLRIGEDLEGDHQDVEGPPSSDDVKTHLSTTVTVDSSPEVKVSLFRDLFRARDDVYAIRWEGRNGKTGYSPAGDKEWDKAPSSGRGSKKSFRITKLFSLTEQVIRDHLLGKQTIGVYASHNAAHARMVMLTGGDLSGACSDGDLPVQVKANNERAIERATPTTNSADFISPPPG
jgi:hypothetical protein